MKSASHAFEGRYVPRNILIEFLRILNPFLRELINGSISLVWIYSAEFGLTEATLFFGVECVTEDAVVVEPVTLVEMGQFGNRDSVCIDTIIIFCLVYQGLYLDSLISGEVVNWPISTLRFLHIVGLHTLVLWINFGETIIGLGDKALFVAILAIDLWVEPLILPSCEFVVLYRLIANSVIGVCIFNMEVCFLVLELELKHLKGRGVYKVSFGLAPPFWFVYFHRFISSQFRFQLELFLGISCRSLCSNSHIALDPLKVPNTAIKTLSFTCNWASQLPEGAQVAFFIHVFFRAISFKTVVCIGVAHEGTGWFKATDRDWELEWGIFDGTLVFVSRHFIHANSIYSFWGCRLTWNVVILVCHSTSGMRQVTLRILLS